MKFLRIFFLTLILALSTSSPAADQKKPPKSWSIENVKKTVSASWQYIVGNVKKAFPSGKTMPPQQKKDSQKPVEKKQPPTTAPTTQEKPSPTKEEKSSTDDKKTTVPPTTPQPDTKPKENQPSFTDKTKATATRWKLAAIAWYTSSVAPKLKRALPWTKEKAAAFMLYLKSINEKIKQKREENRLKREEERNKPNPNKNKRISCDSYGSFGYEGFNLHKGTKRDPFTEDLQALDPEIHFSQRTNIQTEAPKVEEKKPAKTTYIAKLGGVQSGPLSRFMSTVTGLAEHDHSLKNLALYGGLTFLAHSNPMLHKRLPSWTATTKLAPVPKDAHQNVPPVVRRIFFLLNTNLLQYLIGHCIAYKSIPKGLKRALWDDTNMRNLVGLFAGLHLIKDKDQIGSKIFENLPGKVQILIVMSILAAAAKILIDQFVETRNLFLDIKKDLTGKPEALGLKEGIVPEEMRGNRYLVFNSVKSKLTTTIFFILTTVLHGSAHDMLRNKAPETAFILFAVPLYAFIFKALFSQNNTYLLETDLQYLSPKLRERVVQHATSHKILSTMAHSATLASYAQILVHLPTIAQQLRRKKPLPLNVRTLEEIKESLPEAIQAAIELKPADFKSDYYYKYNKTRTTLIKLLLFKLNQQADSDIKQIVDDLIAGKRPALLDHLKRYDHYDYTNRSPLFTTEFEADDSERVTRLENLLAEDIRTHHGTIHG